MRELTLPSDQSSPANAPIQNPDDRWKFLRDVVVFQLKMVVDNLRDFALMPIAAGAALIDLVFKGEREGALFYKVLQWGAQSEKIIDVYSPLRERELPEPGINPEFTIDAVVARLERVVVKECEKGGTAATIKAAMDRTIDQLHKETARGAAGLVNKISPSGPRTTDY